MRKRLLVALVFAAAGLAIGVPVGDWVGLSPAIALVACGAGGAFLGYVISIFLDIFIVGSQTSEIEN